MDIVMNPPNKMSPEMPTAPSKEALAMEFKMDDSMFSENAGGTTITTDKGIELKETPKETTKEVVKQEPVKEFNKEQPAKEVVKEVAKEPIVEDKPKSVLKVPAKKDEKKEEVITPKQEEVVKPTSDGPIVPPGKREDAFDYSKYSPQEVINLKNMSRQSREYAVKLIEENKKLSSQKDGLYLQHEQGYLLSPAFRELSSTRDKLVVEGNAWKAALLAIGNAKPFKEPVGYDNNGKLILSEEKAPNDEDQLRISQIFHNTSNQYSNAQAQLTNYPKQFGDRVNADIIVIKDLQKQMFGWHSDPELMNHSVEVDGKGEQTLNQIKQEFVAQWPQYMSSHPAVQVAADLMISLRIRSAELKEARAASQIAAIKQKEVARGEPSSHETPANQASNIRKGVPSVFSLEGMPTR